MMSSELETSLFRVESSGHLSDYLKSMVSAGAMCTAQCFVGIGVGGGSLNVLADIY